MGVFKNRLRNAAEKTPVFVHRFATKVEIKRIKKPLMTDSDVEYCEKNPEARTQIVKKYIKKNPGYSKQMDANIRKMFSNNDKLKKLSKADRTAMINDMRFCRFAYGTQIDEYVFMDFFDKNKKSSDRRGVVSDTEQRIVRLCCNDMTHAELSDKAKAYDILKKYYKRDALVITKNKDWNRFNKFANKHSCFVVKRVCSSRGNGVEIVDMNTINDRKVFFRSLLDSGKVLLEEVIHQSNELAQFNPDSVNTARVSTFLTKNGVVAPWGFFRTGRKGSFIDNCAAGGVFASLDTINGLTSSNGCDESGNRYDYHPDSNIKMEGFKLPDWDQALALCKEAALLTPEIKYLSWDLAHSDKYGWVIVEVNTCGQMLQQVGNLKGIKSELKEILDQMDLLYPYEFIRSET